MYRYPKQSSLCTKLGIDELNKAPFRGSKQDDPSYVFSGVKTLAAMVYIPARHSFTGRFIK